MEQQHSDQHSLGKFRLSIAESLTIAAPVETPQRQELISMRDALQKELAVAVPLAMAVTDGGTAGGLFPGIQDVPIHIRGSYAKLGPKDSARIERAYQMLFGRRPSEEELVVAQTIVAGGDPTVPNGGWIDLAHLLLCSNEFIYVD